MVALVETYGVITEAEVDAAFVRANAALVEFDAQGGWEIAGAGSAVAWLVGRGHCTRTEAAVHVRNARLAREYTPVGVAASGGDLSPSHLTQLSAVAKHRSHKFAEDNVFASLICGERTAGFGKTAGGQPVKGRLFGRQIARFSRTMRTQRTAKQRRKN